MKTIDERMEADMRRIDSLRSRWRALFTGALVLQGAAFYSIWIHLPLPAAMTLIVASTATIYCAKHCLSLAKRIMRKYEDRPMP